ncbi:MAG: NAD-dependent epimerase/dehydratase family protein [Planctomycetota bacterium]
MKTVLVTGANGFVGRHVCQRLVDDGWRVRAAVRDGTSAIASSPNIARFPVGDLATFPGWHDGLKESDAVVHLAARTHCLGERPGDVLAAYQATNVEGTRRLLEACRGTPVRRFVFMSSIKAVGEGASHAYRETDECHPLDPYGQTKWQAELLTFQLASDLNIEPVVLRSPLVYGSGVRGNLVRLMSLIQRGCPLPLGCVQNARSMIHVENLADAIRVCVDHRAARGEVFHVADAAPVSGRELARRLAKAMGCRARLLPIPVSAMRLLGRVTGKTDFVRRLTDSLVVATDKIQLLTGWTPLVSLDAGLESMVRTFLSGENKVSREVTRKAA